MKSILAVKSALIYLCVILLMATFYACGGQQAQPEQAASPDVLKLEKKYTNLLIVPFETTPEIARDYPEATNEVMSSTMTALQMKNSFQSINIAKPGQNGDSNTLVVKANLTYLRIVGTAARIWVGAFAGSSGIELNLQLIEGGAQKELRTQKLDSANNAWGAAYSGGSTDKSLTTDMGKIVAGYIMACMPEK